MGNKLNTANEVKALGEKELELLASNTHLSKEQIVKFHTEFLTACPDGKLKKSDFVRMFALLHPVESTQAKADGYCEFVFKAFDRDNSGFIDFSEFVIAFAVTSFGDLKQKAEFAFNIFDIDKNNQIDADEMFRVVTSIYDLNGVPDSERQGDNEPKIRVEQIMKALDTNNDKSLSLEEFVNGVVNDENMKKILVDPLINRLSY